MIEIANNWNKVLHMAPAHEVEVVKYLAISRASIRKRFFQDLRTRYPGLVDQRQAVKEIEKIDIIQPTAAGELVADRHHTACCKRLLRPPVNIRNKDTTGKKEGTKISTKEAALNNSNLELTNQPPDNWERRKKRGLIKNEQSLWGYIHPITDKYPALQLRNEVNRYTLATAENFHVGYPKDEKDAANPLKSKSIDIQRTVIGRHGHNVRITKHGTSKAYLNGTEMKACEGHTVKGGETVALKWRKNKIFQIFLTPDYQNNLPPSHFLCVHSLYKKLHISSFATTWRGYNFKQLTPCIITKVAADASWAGKCGETRWKELQSLSAKRGHSDSVCLPFQVSKFSSHIYFSLPLIAESLTLSDRLAWVQTLGDLSHRFIFRQIVAGVSFLHGANITHGNLNPSNVLLLTNNANPIVQITNIGVPYAYDGGQGIQYDTRDILYQPAQVVKDLSENKITFSEPKHDVWSVGVMARHVTNRYLFSDHDDTQLKTYDIYLTEDVKSFLNAALTQPSDESSTTIEKLSNEAWLTNVALYQHFLRAYKRSKLQNGRAPAGPKSLKTWKFSVQ